MTSKLRSRREALGLSQAHLADAANTSQAQIDRLEKGQRKLTQQWAKRLSVPLACHPFDLFDDSPPSLSPREQALLNLFRGLSPEEQEGFLKVADATAHALAESQPGSGRKNGAG